MEIIIELCSQLSTVSLDPWNVVIIVTDEVNTILNYKELQGFREQICAFAWGLRGDI